MTARPEPLLATVARQRHWPAPPARAPPAGREVPRTERMPPCRHFRLSLRMAGQISSFVDVWIKTCSGSRRRVQQLDAAWTLLHDDRPVREASEAAAPTCGQS